MRVKRKLETHAFALSSLAAAVVNVTSTELEITADRRERRRYSRRSFELQKTGEKFDVCESIIRKLSESEKFGFFSETLTLSVCRGK